MSNSLNIEKKQRSNYIETSPMDRQNEKGMGEGKRGRERGLGEMVKLGATSRGSCEVLSVKEICPVVKQMVEKSKLFHNEEEQTASNEREKN